MEGREVKLDNEIMEVLRNAGGPMTSRMIAEELGMESTKQNVQMVCRNLRGLEKFGMVESAWTETLDWVTLKRGETRSNLVWEVKE